jgi:tetratricopeptide (TPR) repeat protein
MRKTIYIGIVAVFFCSALSSCSTAFLKYRQDIFAGKPLLNEQEYTEAQKLFQDAVSNIRDQVSLTFLAVTEYKMGNLENAEKLIQEAAQANPSTLYNIRTFGYRAIIVMKRDKTAGLTALKDYIDRYDYTYPLETVRDLRKMVASGNVDQARMEKIIDEQIWWYESEMELYLSTGNGFYDRGARDNGGLFM